MRTRLVMLGLLIATLLALINSAVSNPIYIPSLQDKPKRINKPALPTSWELAGIRMVSETIHLTLSPTSLKVRGHYNLFNPMDSEKITFVFPGDYEDRIFSPPVDHGMRNFKVAVNNQQMVVKANWQREARIQDIISDPTINNYCWYSWKMWFLSEESQEMDIEYDCWLKKQDKEHPPEGMLLYILSRDNIRPESFESATVTLELDSLDMDHIAKLQPEPTTVLPDRSILWYFTDIGPSSDNNIRVWFNPSTHDTSLTNSIP